jgi:hypothetical protein
MPVVPEEVRTAILARCCHEDLFASVRGLLRRQNGKETASRQSHFHEW